MAKESKKTKEIKRWRKQKLIEILLQRGHTYKQVGEVYGVTKQRIYAFAKRYKIRKVDSEKQGVVNLYGHDIRVGSVKLKVKIKKQYETKKRKG